MIQADFILKRNNKCFTFAHFYNGVDINESTILKQNEKENANTMVTLVWEVRK